MATPTMSPTERMAMLISTVNDVPAGSQPDAAFKPLAGGELRETTKNLQLSRGAS